MRILSTVRLTDNQAKVLAILAANKDKPRQAASELTGTQNLIGARNVLMDLGAIVYADDHASLTDKGSMLALDNNIVDDADNLTDFGKSILPSTNTNNDTQIDLNPTIDNEPNMEGFSPLFTSLLYD